MIIEYYCFKESRLNDFLALEIGSAFAEDESQCPVIGTSQPR
jgi:hypothetical protein